jgi:hypothetical protein
MLRASLAAAFCVFCLAAADTPTLFDGKSLTDWDYLASCWSVRDGMIVGSSDGSLKTNTFLCSQRKFKDFELSFQVRLTSEKRGEANTANSGVQIRSEVIDREKWVVKGPQCDMGGKYWGSLYGEQFGGMMKQADFAKLKPVLKFDEFNDYAIRVVGKKVTITVNGVTTVDQEFANLPDEGIIALQLHQGPKMEAAFKNFKFKELK